MFKMYTGTLTLGPPTPSPAASTIASRHNSHRHIKLDEHNQSSIMDDDDFGDTDFLEALAASEAAAAPRRPAIQQPTPQRIERPQEPHPPAPGPSSRVVQPTPQALPSRSTGSSILVSTRQKGNPILTNIKSMPWEYSDIPADYVLGLTTCALFLSLKYHRLHPEYIYTRIRNLQGKYNLRIILTMVDITQHEEPLKELSKTSLINNVTVILCWSAAEAARYLELYKSYEHAGHKAIQAPASSSYADKVVDFITVPRSVNKTDAVGIVGAFGSVKGAVNARPEEVAVVQGWGEKKVRRWCEVVQEPFRVRKAARRGLGLRAETTGESADGEEDGRLDAVPLSRVPLREMSSVGEAIHQERSLLREESSMFVPEDVPQKLTQPQKQDQPFRMMDLDDDDDEDAFIAAAEEEEATRRAEERKERARKDNELSDGVAAALAKLRKQ
jgi:DNA excision repair protein ERCC-1